ncbi:hypothetical protein BSR28_01300 [Boudabousia liubingyangii]|uniref:hypothetical protein n=1 Tax=Boudabousia liubingyangii TaxID=1921764 RepID=UPI00093C8678|nr:hypothetical protein [Boudabousia liubingyangii]OKL48367.1 hypothetical protein BSR28_01300 [Boudabousia liubingyangii]
MSNQGPGVPMPPNPNQYQPGNVPGHQPPAPQPPAPGYQPQGYQQPRPAAPAAAQPQYQVPAAYPGQAPAAIKPLDEHLKTYLLRAALAGLVTWVGLAALAMLQALVLVLVQMPRLPIRKFSGLLSNGFMIISNMLGGFGMSSGLYVNSEHGSADSVRLYMPNFLAFVLLMVALAVVARQLELRLPAKKHINHLWAALVTVGVILLMHIIVGFIMLAFWESGSGFAVTPSLFFVAFPLMVGAVMLGRSVTLKQVRCKVADSILKFVPSVRAAFVTFLAHFTLLFIISFVIVLIIVLVEEPQLIMFLLWPLLDATGIVAVMLFPGALFGSADLNLGGGKDELTTFFALEPQFLIIGLLLMAVGVVFASGVWARLRVPDAASGLPEFWTLPLVYALMGGLASYLLRFSGTAYMGRSSEYMGAGIHPLTIFMMLLIGIAVELLGRFVPAMGVVVIGPIARLLSKHSFSPSVSRLVNERLANLAAQPAAHAQPAAPAQPAGPAPFQPQGQVPGTPAPYQPQAQAPVAPGQPAPYQPHPQAPGAPAPYQPQGQAPVAPGQPAPYQPQGQMPSVPTPNQGGATAFPVSPNSASQPQAPKPEAGNEENSSQA